MFPSTTNIHPFENLYSSFNYNNFPPLFSSSDTTNNVFFDPLTGQTTMAVSDIHNSTPNAEYYYGTPLNFLNQHPRKMMTPVKVKKDRHSKICTAQGFRDRRVRLSIEIAREFFDLQDMLGFDKASKTLEWLLTKSRKAINELAELKHTSGGECGEVVSENSGDLLEGISVTTSKFEDKKMEKLHKVAKQSRDKARARARQRTKLKMCTTSTTSPQMLTQFEAYNKQFASNSFMPSSLKNIVAHPSHDVEPNQQDQEEDNESNYVLKKMNPTLNFGYHQQQNLGLSKDVSNSCASSNYNFNLPQNWEIDGAIPHSTLHAT